VERRDESRGDHASRPTRCACDCEKRRLRWARGKVGEFDSGSKFVIGLDSGSGLGSGSEPGSAQIQVKV
jgi:hypothetical protein